MSKRCYSGIWWPLAPPYCNTCPIGLWSNLHTCPPKTKLKSIKHTGDIYWKYSLKTFTNGISKCQTTGLCMRFGRKLDMMRLRHNEVNLASCDDDYQNLSKCSLKWFWVIWMSSYVTSKFTSLCLNLLMLIFFLTNLHSPNFLAFDILHITGHLWTFWHLTSYLNHLSLSQSYKLYCK